MSGGLADLFPVILVAAAVAVAASPPFTRLAAFAGLVDMPGSAPHKRHLSATPLAGGPILALAAGLAQLVLPSPADRLVAGILLGSLLMLVWGLADDRFGMPPYVKLVGQLAATGILIAFGIQVRLSQVNWLDLSITLLWVVGLANAFNFVDSMDGLALGLAGVATAFFMLVTLESGQPQLAHLAAALLGATIGLYFYNASPAKLFLGDSGAQVLGIATAAIGIAYVPAGAGLPQGVSWFTPILVLGVPLFDASLVIVSRLRRGRPVYEAQRDHTYHRLVALGLHPSRSVLAMHITAVLLGLLAFVALRLTVIQANLVFGVIILGGLGALAFLERTFKPEAVAVPIGSASGVRPSMEL